LDDEDEPEDDDSLEDEDEEEEDPDFESLPLAPSDDLSLGVAFSLSEDAAFL